MAFAQPDQFLGKTIELAGDELTEEQIAAVFTRVIGRPVKLVTGQNSSMTMTEDEQKAMSTFYNGVGYDADIAALRKMYPGLQTLEQFLRRTGWENAQPVSLSKKLFQSSD